MTLSTIIEAIGAFLGLVREFERGSKQAEKRLKDILPARTYTQLAREREREKDRAKFK